MNDKLTKTQGNILLLLQDKGPLKADEIAKGLGISTVAVYKNLGKLTDYECVSKDFNYAGGRGFKYTYKSGHISPNYMRNAEKRIRGNSSTSGVAPSSGITHTPISREGIESLLRKWSTEQWRPKIFSSARNLPLGVAKLYEFTTNIAYGGVHTDNDIDKAMKPIKDFERDLEQALAVVKGILASKDLKTIEKLYAFLASGADMQEIQNMVVKVRELN